MRLFVAIHFSSDVKNVLLDTMNEIRVKAVSCNVTRPENLHLTLAFIGESSNVVAIQDAINQTALPSFSMTVGGFGHFGDLYWVGIEKNSTLSILATNLQNALRARGFDIEKRAFKPHITVARRVVTTEPMHINVPSTTMTVERISLMKSERIFGKLTYTEIFSKIL